jgi:hypothetical protein
MPEHRKFILDESTLQGVQSTLNAILVLVLSLPVAFILMGFVR